MSLKPRESIKKIRQCKTLDEERCLVNKESAEIRNLSKVRSSLFTMNRTMQKNMQCALYLNASLWVF